MCGITGVLDPSRALAGDTLEGLAEQMAGTLAHRGPDGAGAWRDASRGVALGQRRLAVIDPSVTGTQPMTSRCGRYTVVFNGEIYNFRTLRGELEKAGHGFRGHSDTEVLVEAISAHGVRGAVERCNGMFAFAAWDAQEDCLSLARDRVGEKPLYYGSVDGRMVFASELKAFTALPGFAGDVDPLSVDLFLRYTYIPAPRSIYRDVWKLPAGTILTVPGGSRGSLPEPETYWSVSDVWLAGQQQPFEGDETALLDELDALLTDAVGTRMVADVPLGAFLSGGVDSTLTTALMQAQSTEPVRTFTVAVGDPSLDEAAHARAVADHLGTAHTEVALDVRDAIDLIPQLPQLYDEPFADPSQIPTALIARAARRDITVGMSGDGGDELFAGYNRHRGARLWSRLAGVPVPARRGAASLLQRVSVRSWDRAARLATWGTPDEQRVPRVGDKLHRLAEVLRADSVESLYEALAGHWPPGALTGSQAAEGWQWPGEFAADPLNAVMLADVATTLPDNMLVKLDRATMAVGLEARVPLLDHRLVEFAARTPPDTKLRDGRGKWPLRELVARYLPSELVERPKQGFDPPIGDWLRGPLREWAESLLAPDKLEAAGLGPELEPVDDTWHDHLRGRRNHDYRLWAVLTLSAWKESQRAAASPAAAAQKGHGAGRVR